MTHAFIARILFGIAWLLLLIGMFVPQVWVDIYRYGSGFFDGYIVTFYIFYLGTEFWLSLSDPHFFKGDVSFLIIILTIALSEWLFIFSPLVLIKASNTL